MGRNLKYFSKKCKRIFFKIKPKKITKKASVVVISSDGYPMPVEEGYPGELGTFVVHTQSDINNFF